MKESKEIKEIAVTPTGIVCYDKDGNEVDNVWYLFLHFNEILQAYKLVRQGIIF